MSSEPISIPLPDPEQQRKDPIAFAIAAARAVADEKTADVIVLDLRGLSSVADAFVIGTGTSDRQMDAALDAVKLHAKAIERQVFREAGRREGRWVLADYVDVVVHLFDEDHRGYYALDSLWGDAKRIAWTVDGLTSNTLDDDDL